MTHATVHRRHVTRQDDALRCQVRRGIGFEAYCACGWVGKIRRSHSAARADAHLHRCEDVTPAEGTES